MTLVGIDFGSLVSRIAQLDPEKKMPVIVRNNLCLENTKTCVSFVPGEARQFGENANSKVLSRPKAVVTDVLGWLLNGQKDETRQVGDEEVKSSQIVSFFLKGLLSFTQPSMKISIALPNCSLEASTVLREAMEIIGKTSNDFVVVDCGEASLVYLHHLQRSSFNETPSIVAIVDVGHCFTTVTIGSLSTDSVEKIHSSSLEIGSRQIDFALTDHIFDTLGKQHPNADLKCHTKSFEKVVRECRKAKEMLSSVDTARVQAESLKDDIDVNLPLTRLELERLAKPMTDKLVTFLKSAVDQCNIDLSSARVEAIGGGWRAPIIQEAIKQVFGCSRIGVSLDCNLAVAEGASILALCLDKTVEKRDPLHDVTLANFSSPFQTGASSSDIEILSSKENAFEARDYSITKRIQSINSLDAYIIQTLEASQACLKGERLALLSNTIRDAEIYVQDNCNDEAVELIDEKLHSLKQIVKNDFPEIEAHYEVLKEEQRRKDEELERLSKLQSEDRELKSDPQRLRGAQQRREQGQALFKQEHWSEAQTRFVQALAILGELYDVNDTENKKKKDEISLSCYLNIASCSIKLSMWRIALNNATSALEISPNNPKALFRRGQALSMLGDYTLAIKDLEAAKISSNSDAAVVAELDVVLKKEASEKAREKKMFAKMFA
mmetsp:Transcript_69244/g.80787  ORF Transcript_69244/g.80787 Transcript_69244/m.80787 type:complete len:665 (+) Transcript_69244:69-2063(+)